MGSGLCRLKTLAQPAPRAHLASSNPLVSCFCVQTISYVIHKPTREILFTVVTREEKYKAKVVIDTLILRLGDATSGALMGILASSTLREKSLLTAVCAIVSYLSPAQTYFLAAACFFFCLVLK